MLRTSLIARTLLAVASVATIAASSVSAVEAKTGVETYLDAASAAYDRGDYATATARYEQAVAAGDENGHLFYNLGLSYYREHRLGDAMAAFLAARRLLPRDPD